MGNARKMRIYVDMTDVKTQDLNIQTLHSCPLHGSSFGWGKWHSGQKSFTCMIKFGEWSIYWTW
jgi:hypothetical protein